MVIIRPGEFCGESAAAFGNRSASSMSKESAGLNSDPETGSFWVENRDANHVD